MEMIALKRKTQHVPKQSFPPKSNILKVRLTENEEGEEGFQ